MVDCRKPSLIQQEISFYFYQTPVWLLGFPSNPSYAVDACFNTWYFARGAILSLHIHAFTTLFNPKYLQFLADVLVTISRVGPPAFYYISISGRCKERPFMG